MCWALVGILLLSFAANSSAQPPAEPYKAPAEAGTPATAKPGPQAAEFARLNAQVHKILTDAKTLKMQYQSADAGQRAAIAKKYHELIDRGTVLMDQLVAAAEKAYVESPNADKEVSSLLFTVLASRVDGDDDEAAYDLGKLMLDHHCTAPQVAGLTGVAAFNIGELDDAEKYLQFAVKAGKVPDEIQNVFQALPANKQAWEKEKKIRAAEAKADDLPRVLLKTNRGDIEVELFENEAPNTVANFISLVEKGFYNGLTFHRVLAGFMAQGGDPKGDGGGGPGYQIAEEFTKPNHRLHFRGSLSMARTDDPNSAGSQFFLMFAPNSQLDGKYTVFGRVIKGFEVLAKIQRRDPDELRRNPQAVLPTPDKIVTAEVLRKRPHKYTVKTLAE
jgi:cyclophilin family peptidyl-prolyl cis-trans isomerase